jgi:hypothetical protein
MVAKTVPDRVGWFRDWPHWAPYAAVVWSLFYGVLAIYWAVSGRGFPYSQSAGSDLWSPLVGRFGTGVAWTVVVVVGIPAAAVGILMLRGVQGRVVRPLVMTGGSLLAVVLLLLMNGLDLLTNLGYIPYGIISLIAGSEFGLAFVSGLAQWALIHQLLCLTGGFLWLAATVSYARRSGDACQFCGRRDGPEGWQSPNQAARWGRTALYISLVAPIFYAFTRYAWALGFPLGMTEEYLRSGQERGIWISGLSLATFGLVGAALSLGLVQHWGEVFPRWVIGLARRPVPIALGVIPASLVSVVLIVGGIVIGSGLGQLVDALAASGANGMDLVGGIIFQVGPTLLFPVWGLALAVATLGYYYRRRGPCSVCGRGVHRDDRQPAVSHS